MNRLLPLLFVLACASTAFGQHGKAAPNFKGTQAPQSPQLNWSVKNNVPLAENPFNIETPVRKPIPSLVPRTANNNADVRLTLGENGLPIMMEGKTAASGSAADSKPMAQRALDYLVSLAPMRIAAPAQEFVVKTVQTDEQGNNHIRIEQVFQGLPIWGSELIAHTKNGAFERVNGRYFPTPQLATTVPALDKTTAMNLVKNAIGVEKVKTSWSEEDLKMIDGQPFSAELLVFHVDGALQGEHLAWHVTAHPNVLSRLVYFVDAVTGEILDTYDNTCNFVGHRVATHGVSNAMPNPCPVESNSNATLVNGPVTIQGQDLFNTNRSFSNGGWQAGSTIYMENTNTSMYNASGSNLPNDPVGVIVTLDGLNTSPENNSFDYTVVGSSSTTFTNQKASISAHYNAGVSFDYYKSKFNRNSIDGIGGNILSFVNITESDGTSMENAFWNGSAMWYGNGGSTFKPLARGLDVGGHEMTHGVVEKTANLVYQGESGALNESFADVFGVLIENDTDWKIGEDVMQTGGGLPASLRDLSNPHNGFSSGSPWWQPNHTNEKYTGSQDNGGVHINSGIPNYAFYLFTTNAAVGKAKAEQVYYKALRDYLTKSSKFVDCRIAVIQAATDLYGAAVANVAASAFTAVGIGGTAPSGNYLGQLNPNPGTDYVLCVSNDLQKLDLANGTGTILETLYNQGLQTRPSITDEGKEIVFVNTAGDIIYLGVDYSSNPPTTLQFELSTAPEWRQAAISKDGRYVAALSNVQEPYIYVFDFTNNTQQKFKLYNPTYSQGQITGDVDYADVLEFDYSGKNLMYDSYNSLSNNQNQDISYWDIGFLEFWKSGQFAPANSAFISKLFSGIPENTSIGDPAFSKNSPFVLAFDYIDQTTANTRFDIYGVNSETGDYDILVSNNGAQGWPNYNRLDTKILFETNPTNGIYNIRLQGVNATKIQPSGNTTSLISNHSWGVWYGNGSRSLLVGSHEPSSSPLQVSVSPNPVQGLTQISMISLEAADAQISVSNLFGQTMLTRAVKLQEGENVLDFDMSTLPAGSYLVRIAAGAANAVVKVIKG